MTLTTDTLGITHVVAGSDADAMYGAGYAMARDRLTHMEIARRQALGRQAELFGDKSFKADVGARAFGFARLGQADWELLQRERPEDARLVRAWIQGVNARLAEVRAGTAPRPWGLGKDALDFVPEPWGEWEPFAIGKVLAFGMSNSLDAELLATAVHRLAPDFAAKAPIVQAAWDSYPMAPGVTAGSASSALAPPPPPPPRPPLPSDPTPRWIDAHAWPASPGGSNNWAVSGAHTDNGAPYLAGDPHQALTSPTRLWPVHLDASSGGGSLDVVGFSFVGTPGVQLGHNAHVGWTATTNFADVMDLLDVKTDPDKTVVTLGDGDHAVVTRTETILVRDTGPVGTGYEQQVDLHDVPGVGILLPEEILPLPRAFLASHDAILFMWTGFGATRELSGYLAMDRARTLDEWEAGARILQVGAANFVAADRSGIRWVVQADVPDRGKPGSHPMPWKLVDGSDPAALWTRGFLDASKLPGLRDPAAGYLATANTDPFGFTADGSVDDDAYYYGSFYANGARRHRIVEALEATLAKGTKVTRADMEALQADVHSDMADTLVPELTDAAAQIGKDPALAEFVGDAAVTDLAAALGGWDRAMKRDSAPALAFLALEWFAAKRLFETAATPTLFDAIQSKSPPFFLGLLRNVTEGRFAASKDFLPKGRAHLLLSATADAAAWLTKRFGAGGSYRLRDVVAVDWTPMMTGGRWEVPRTPVGGGFDTISVAAVPFFKNGDVLDACAPADGPLYRMVIGFAADGTPETTLDFARGTREEPDDPHFADWDARWANSEHAKLPFRPDEVKAGAEATITLRAR